MVQYFLICSISRIRGPIPFCTKKSIPAHFFIDAPTGRMQTKIPPQGGTDPVSKRIRKMRSMMLALAVAAMAVVSTGCTMSCKFSGPCKSLSQSCTMSQAGPSCSSCMSDSCSGCSGGNTTCNVVQPMCASAGGCDDGCPNGLMGGAGGSMLGLGLFERGSMCSTGGGGQIFGRGRVRGALSELCGKCGNNCGGDCSGAGASGFSGGAGMMSGTAGLFNCSRCGGNCGGRCGMGGMGAKMNNAMGNIYALGHPYAGAIPHTTPQPTYGGGAGPTPQYSYPYYTTRGPRDFLMSNPPSIGR